MLVYCVKCETNVRIELDQVTVSAYQSAEGCDSCGNGSVVSWDMYIKCPVNPKHTLMQGTGNSYG